MADSAASLFSAAETSKIETYGKFNTRISVGATKTPLSSTYIFIRPFSGRIFLLFFSKISIQKRFLFFQSFILVVPMPDTPAKNKSNEIKISSLLLVSVTFQKMLCIFSLPLTASAYHQCLKASQLFLQAEPGRSFSLPRQAR